MTIFTTSQSGTRESHKFKRKTNNNNRGEKMLQICSYAPRSMYVRLILVHFIAEKDGGRNNSRTTSIGVSLSSSLDDTAVVINTRGFVCIGYM